MQTGDASNTRVSPLDFDQMRVIGEAQQQWAPLRRKYNLFTYHQTPNPATDMGSQKFSLPGSELSRNQQTQLTQVSQEGQGDFNQFAYVNEPFLSWDFSLRSAQDRLIGSVNRNFVGFARELFTDTGVYALRMDSAGVDTESQRTPPTGMTLDQRAVMLATAVSIDFDYFSRHSGSSGFGFMPLWFPGIGGEAATGGAAAGGAAAGEAGAMTGAAGGALGGAGTAAGGIAEGVGAGVAGAGAMAGYEAMQRGMSGQQDVQNVPPEQSGGAYDQQFGDQPGFYEDQWPEHQQQDDFWGRDDPWGDDDGGGSDGGDGDGFDWF